MQIESVPIESLVMDDRNARRGDVGELMKSLGEFGQHRPVVAQRSTRKILIGNHMTAAATALGWTEIAVTWVDDDDKTALRRALADNLVADRSKWDEDQLKSLLAELDAVALPGLDNRQLDRLLAEAAGPDIGTGPLLPIVARPGEAYNYVTIIGTNEIDNTWLADVFSLRKEQSWKSNAIGTSRVISAQQFRAALVRAIADGAAY